MYGATPKNPHIKLDILYVHAYVCMQAVPHSLEAEVTK